MGELRTEVAGDRGDGLGRDEVHHILSNERRRLAFRVLDEADEPVDVRELSERVATLETGEDPAPRDVRHTVYVSLQQNHIPQLTEHGVVEYDEDAKTVRLGHTADEVGVYMEVVPRYGLSWGEYYFAVSVVSLLCVLAAELGAPVFAGVRPRDYALVFLVVLMASAVYQTGKQGSSVFDRL